MRDIIRQLWLFFFGADRNHMLCGRCRRVAAAFDRVVRSYCLFVAAVALTVGSDMHAQGTGPIAGRDVPDILVDNFDEGKTDGLYYERSNSLGEYQGTWAKRPSFTIIDKSEIHRRGDTGKALVLHYKKESGWCGWYTLLGELDLSNLNVLSFWIKGDVGGERFDIGLIDRKRQALGMDAIYAGPVDAFLEGGVTREWQEVKVPLSRVGSDIDMTSVTNVVFWCRYGGEGMIYIDDMLFKYDLEIAADEAANMPQAKRSKWHPRSMWVWKVDPVVNVKARAEIIDTCKRAATDVIYLFFGDFDQHRDPQYTESLKEFLAECHQHGLSIELLTGNPNWALKKNHQTAINWLRPFLEFNRQQPPHLRFDGVSFDVEPYLADEWKTDKERIKVEYLELLQKLRDMIDSYSEQKFKLGCAIPVFYIDEGTFEEDILVLSDYVALMDYYDSADDMIKHAEEHLYLAKKLGKKIWIGIEMQDLVAMRQGMRRNTFFEEGWEYMESELEKIKDAYAHHPGYGGLAMHCYYAYRKMQKGRTTPQNSLRLEKAENDIFRIPSFRRTRDLKIDGDLSEWELSVPYTVSGKDNVVYGQGSWDGDSDLSFHTYSMWDEDNLYFAFTVTDNVLWQESRGSKMWQGDHIELWLDVDLGEDFLEAVNSNDDFQFGLSPGNLADASAETCIWTPSIEKAPAKAEIGAKRIPQGYTLEVRLPRTLLYNPESVPMSICDIQPISTGRSGRKVRYVQRKDMPVPEAFSEGYRLGISIEASDTDDVNVQQKALMSTTLDRIWGDPTKFGYLEFRGELTSEVIARYAGVGLGNTGMSEGEYGTADKAQAGAATQQTAAAAFPEDAMLTIDELPPLPKGTKIANRMLDFAYRGRLGAFELRPDKAATSVDDAVFFDPVRDTVTNDSEYRIETDDTESINVVYEKVKPDYFCGAYFVLLADLSEFTTLSFLVKGAAGRESFEIGINDAVSNIREDAVFVGAINRYLPGGVTTDWQVVKIPLADFYGNDLARTFSIALLFNEVGGGEFWIDELRITKKTLVDRDREIEERGFLLLDDFDHSDLNLLGRKTSTYKRLPSFCITDRVPEPRVGSRGRSLRLQYTQDVTGWSGYYTLLNQVDGMYYDLEAYESVSFQVRGETGGENFEIGMADKNWLIIGDSLKAGQITDFLPEGVTTEWQTVAVPLRTFGQLDLSQMGSFVINFNTRGEQTIYIDNIKFHLR